MKLSELKGKKVLILGFGREGRDTLKFLKKTFPKNTFGIADRIKTAVFNEKFLKLGADKNLNRHLGEEYLSSVAEYEIIVKTPGIPLTAIKPFLKKGTKITSQTELFLDNCPGRVVGITGTKGKSTTSSLIYKVLKTGGKKAYLAGNIGIPALSYLAKAKKGDIYVFEMSCHQLAELKTSPDVAVFLNLYPEHLDYYKNFSAYAKAKANITLWQDKKDCLIYNPDDKKVSRFAAASLAKKIKIDTAGVEKTIILEDIPLKGDFNLINVSAAIKTGEIFGIPRTKIAQAIKKFKTLDHRLEKIGPYKGITFYNDSLSTIEQSAIAAIEALGNNVETIFLGGFDRGLTFKHLSKKILSSGNIKTLILFPTTGRKIWKEIKRQSKGRIKTPQAFFADNMSDAVKLGYEHTSKGKICLMSCASTSFGMFRDYQERGELFKKYIKEFGENEKNN
ncbi:MAG: UDP-N-acetylmuramoyl-L-alanine--D-glutamate ligase [Candidatus Paceibacterota bacterium]|jgi:UDP-N-acetylmuramoylalanine--D-glutamate ligase